MKLLRLLICAGAVAMLAALGAAGCGVKGPPMPPQEVLPERIADLRAASAPNGIRLEWSRPEYYTSGHKMRDLGSFVVLRAEGAEELKPLVELPVTDRERFQQQRHLGYIDTNAQIGGAYRYQVISLTTDGYQSGPSNEVTMSRTAAALKPPADKTDEKAH